MIRRVRTADGRTWWVRSSISWTRRAMTERFEHDMTDFGHGVIMLIILTALTLFVVFWTPAEVVRPAWFVLLVFLILLMLPVSWAMQRPWLIRVHTNGPVGTDGEHWEEVVRGMIPARETVYQIVDELRKTGTPDDGNGSLERVGPIPPVRDS